MIEESSAVKCPSISYHLTGTKKVQQELAKPGVLERYTIYFQRLSLFSIPHFLIIYTLYKTLTRFIDNKDDIAKLRKCFAGLWSLDDIEIVKNAIEKPELYVMKPQREGGGTLIQPHIN